MSVTVIILIATATTTALIAGLFYAGSFSVTPGLRNVPDTSYILFMQSTNKAILNPIFFISFLGTALLLPVSTFLYYNKHSPYPFRFLLIATCLYLIGVIGVTALGNIPLNNALANFNLQSATPEAIALQRAGFEKRWNLLNNIRTFFSTITLILVIIACVWHQEAPAVRQ